MKKKILIPLLCLCPVLLTACGNTNTISDNTSNVPDSSQKEETSESMDIKETEDNTDGMSEKKIQFDELSEAVSTDIENTISAVKSDYEKLITEFDTYEKYSENTEKIETFYKQVYEDTKDLCIRMREYSMDYAKEIMSSDKSNDDKYEDFEELYDCIYDDAGDDIYDEIYDGILEDLYDDFYDGILEDADDNGVPYKEWYKVRSDEYEMWSDTRSDVYKEWSDFRSDVYEFWSDIRSELWSDDIERAEEKIVDFQEDIEKLKNKADQSDDETSNEENDSDAAPKETETNDDNTNDELVDGMRPEFKEAMDSYEAFYNEYFEIIKKYTENPSDMELLADYTDMLSKAAEMTEKFEAWENNDLNSVELKYYLDVNSRITQKFLEVS